MNTFELDVLSRLPLAEAVWTTLDYIWTPERLDELFERHRRTGWTGKITFGLLTTLVSEALTRHHGSGLKSFDAAQKDGRLTASVQAAYAKLGNIPPELSQAFLMESAFRLQEIAPSGRANELPPALRQFAVIVVDGKKIKNLAKRLKVLRSLRGKALGGKVLGALWLNEGMVIGMEVSLDGEANDAPLTPGLVAQVNSKLANVPRLYVADRQFCDLKIPHMIRADDRDHFLIRFSKKLSFSSEKTAIGQDELGRTIVEEWGWLGRAADPRRMYVRRITLKRPGEEDVILITSLLDAEEFPSDQLLLVYLQRWTIERVFQQITEVFELRRLISSSPSGAVFQFAICATLYNLTIMFRDYIADAQHRDAHQISTENLFTDICDELTVCRKLLGPKHLEMVTSTTNSASGVRLRLTDLLRCWSDAWAKSKPKKRTAAREKKVTAGGHFSAWKVMNQARSKEPLEHG